MTELVIRFEIDGIHYWPNAPDQYSEFGQPHRHLFKVICFYEASGSQDPNRREQELWELRQDAIERIRSRWGRIADFKGRSCEGIADVIKELTNASKVFVGEEWSLGALVY